MPASPARQVAGARTHAVTRSVRTSAPTRKVMASTATQATAVLRSHDKSNSGSSGHRKHKASAVDELLQRVMHATPCTEAAPPANAATAMRTAAACTLLERLSMMLHAMCLVTFIERAQGGALFAMMHNNINSNSGSAGAVSSLTATAHAAVCAYADVRWLEAVTRQCGVTVTLDDVAKVAAAFPQWVDVQWSLRRPVALVCPAVTTTTTTTDTTTTTSTDVIGDTTSCATATTSLSVPSSLPALREEDVVARVRVHGVTPGAVPSVASAAAALHARLAALPDEAARQAMRRTLACTTAYSALVAQEQQQQQQQHDTEVARVSQTTNAQRSCTAQTTHNSTHARRSNDNAYKENTGTEHDDDDEEARALLQLQDELSPELRAALSRTRLRDVVAYMRRCHARDDVAAHARIERAQARERVLATYEHVCSLYGRTRSELNAWQLLCALEQQTRFDADEHTHRSGNASDARAQLELLLSHHRHTGLSAVVLDADAVDASTSLSQQQQQQHNDERVALRAVTSLRGLSDVALHSILVRLDRHKASLRGLQAALQHEQQRDAGNANSKMTKATSSSTTTTTTTGAAHASVALPYVLCFSRPMRHMSSTLSSLGRSAFAPAAIAHDLRQCAQVDTTTALSRGGGRRHAAAQSRGAAHEQQQQQQHDSWQRRQRGLQAIARWCALRESLVSRQTTSNTATPPSTTTTTAATATATATDDKQDGVARARRRAEAIEKLDVAAVQWVHDAVPTLPCAQCLVLVSLLAHVLCIAQPSEDEATTVATTTAAAVAAAQHNDRLVQEDDTAVTTSSPPSPSPPSSSSLSTALQDNICRLLATLTQRAVASARLEAQPLTLLVSALYGLHRAAQLPRVAGDRVALSALQLPRAMLFAVLQHMRHTDATLRTLDRHPRRGIEVLLTLAVLLDRDVRAALVSANDLMALRDVYMSHLRKHLQPQQLQTQQEEQQQQQQQHESTTQSVSVMRSGRVAAHTLTVIECTRMLINVSCLVSNTIVVDVFEYVLTTLKPLSTMSTHELRRLCNMCAVLPSMMMPVTRCVTQHLLQRANITDTLTWLRLVPFVTNATPHVLPLFAPDADRNTAECGDVDTRTRDEAEMAAMTSRLAALSTRDLLLLFRDAVVQLPWRQHLLFIQFCLLRQSNTTEAALLHTLRTAARVPLRCRDDGEAAAADDDHHAAQATTPASAMCATTADTMTHTVALSLLLDNVLHSLLKRLRIDLPPSLHCRRHGSHSGDDDDNNNNNNNVRCMFADDGVGETYLDSECDGSAMTTTAAAATARSTAAADVVVNKSEEEEEEESVWRVTEQLVRCIDWRLDSAATDAVAAYDSDEAAMMDDMLYATSSSSSSSTASYACRAPVRCGVAHRVSVQQVLPLYVACRAHARLAAALPNMSDEEVYMTYIQPYTLQQQQQQPSSSSSSSSSSSMCTSRGRYSRGDKATDKKSNSDGNDDHEDNNNSGGGGADASSRSLTVMSLVAMRTLLPLMRDTAVQRRVVAHMVDGCAPWKRAHVLRFLLFVAPLATRLRVYDEAVVARLLLAGRLRIPITAREQRRSGTSLYRSRRSMQQLTESVCNMIDYILAVMTSTSISSSNSSSSSNNNTTAVALSQLQSATQALQTMRSWLSQYFRVLLLSSSSSSATAAGDTSATSPGAASDVKNNVRDGDGDEDSSVVDANDGEADVVVRSGNDNKATATTTTTTRRSQDECASSLSYAHDSDADALLISEAELERVLECVMRVDGRVPYKMHSIIARRVHAKMAALATQAAHDDDDNNSSSSSTHRPREDRVEAEGVTEATDDDATRCPVPVDQLPLPLHFVHASRADVLLPVPLCASYLQHMLRTCSLPSYNAVVHSFLHTSSARRKQHAHEHDAAHGPAAQWASDTAVLCTVALRTLLHERLVQQQQQRQDEAAQCRDNDNGNATTTTQPTWLTAASELSDDVDGVFRAAHPVVVIARVVRSVLLHLDAPQSASSEREDEGDEASATTTTTTTTTNDTNNTDKDELSALLCEALTYMSDATVRIIALDHMHRLARVCRPLARAVLTRVQPTLATWPLRELLHLSRTYDEAAPVVVRELRARHDVRGGVEFVVFLALLKHQPMEVNAVVVRAHLPHLRFSGCARLLASLLPRCAAVPLTLLRDVLARVEALAPTATETERVLLLDILRTYYNNSKDSSGSNTTGDEVEQVRRVAQQRMLLACCERLLLLDAVRDVDALQRFLALHASASHHEHDAPNIVMATTTTTAAMTTSTADETCGSRVLMLPPSMCARIIAQAEQLLQPMLHARDAVATRAMVRLLHSYDLLHESTAQLVLSQLFAPVQQGEATASATDDENSNNNNSSKKTTDDTSSARVGGDELAVYVELLLLLVSEQTATKASAQLHARATDALRALVQHCRSTSQRLALLVLLTDLCTSNSSSNSSSGNGRVHAAWLHDVVDELCRELLCCCGGGGGGDRVYDEEGDGDAVGAHATPTRTQLRASEFAKLMQCISRLKKWHLVHDNDDDSNKSTTSNNNNNNNNSNSSFDKVFRAAYERADAHSRCVVLKALCADAHIFARYGDEAMALLQGDIASLSPDDMELVLSATLQLRHNAVRVEAVLDAVGTRLLLHGALTQCRSSTLVRLLQCHAAAGVCDDVALVTAVLRVLEAQCARDVKLDTLQVLTLLEATAALHARVPARLLLLCFDRLERALPTLSLSRLAQLGELVVAHEMGYGGAVRNIVRYVLHHRDGVRSGSGSSRFRDVVELLCDVYDVDVPPLLRAVRLRQRRHDERVAAYWQQQRNAQAQAAAAAQQVAV